MNLLEVATHIVLIPVFINFPKPFQVQCQLKGVFSKPSGDCIVAMLSILPQTLHSSAKLKEQQVVQVLSI